MGRAGVDLGRAALFDQRVRRVHQRARGVDQVVHQDALLTLDVADDVHDLGHVRLGAALVDDGERHIQLFGELARAGDRAQIGRDDHGVLRADAELARDIRDEHGRAQHVIHRDVEKALDLRGVQVHGQHAVRACGGDQVRHQLGRDRVARLALAVLTRVAEIRDDRGDAAGGRALARVDHDEQLHQVVVDRAAGRLDEEHVRAAHGFRDGNRDLTVRKGGDSSLADRQAERGRDLHRQRRVGVAGENLDVFSVRNHGSASVIFKVSGLFLYFLLRQRLICFSLFRAAHGGGRSSPPCWSGARAQRSARLPARPW